MTGRSPKAKDPASILAISVMLLIVGVAGTNTRCPRRHYRRRGLNRQRKDKP